MALRDDSSAVPPPGPTPAPSEESATPAASGHRALSVRVLKSFFVVVVLALPAILVGVLWHPQAAAPMILGGIVGMSAVVPGGTRLGLGITGLLLLVTPIAIVSGEVPLAGACLMALLCMASGITALWGLESALVLVPLVMAYFVIQPYSLTGEPPDRLSQAYLATAALLVAGGSLWLVLVTPVLKRRRDLPALEPAPRRDAVVYTVGITVLCSVSTFAVMTWAPGSRGAWLVLTILVVAKLGGRATVARSLYRVVGTVIGALLAAVVAEVAPAPGAQIGIALILLVVAMTARSGPYYWLYVAFMTPVVVLLSSPGQVLLTGEWRVAYTLIGAGLVLLSVGLVFGYAHLHNIGRIRSAPANNEPDLAV